jgi:cytochrome c
VLGTALIVFGLRELSGVIYHVDKPEKQGYVIEVAEGSGEAAPAEAAEAPAVPLGQLLAQADVAKGQTFVGKNCASCHDLSKASANKVGPGLWGIVGRNHAAHADFKYSEAMAAKSAEPWTYEALDAFLTKPSAAIKGTKMTYGGIKSEADRANVLAYLQTLADTPVPFPAP